MTSRIRLVLPALLLAILPIAATAQPPFRHGFDHQEPGRHPHYLRALSDLRSARWLLLSRPGGPEVSRDEQRAVFAIEKAINEITRAAINDGKDLRAALAIDVPRERGGRLHRALDLLESARDAVSHAEDDARSRGLRNRALIHIQAAMHSTREAIEDRRFGGRR